jgi:hypothetical protein
MKIVIKVLNFSVLFLHIMKIMRFIMYLVKRLIVLKVVKTINSEIL